MINICHNCLYHEKCIMYRYSNVQTKFMKKVHRMKNRDGEMVIYVEECSKFTKRMFLYSKRKLEKLKQKKGIDKSE